VLLVAVVAVALAGCGGGAETEVDTRLAGCDELSTPAASTELPALELPCFTGGEPVVLSDLRGPAVVNLWASWCPPCREELPVLQRYADRNDGEVSVVGVVTRDSREKAASLADGLGITFPALDDRGGELLAQLGAAGLPVTLFVDRSGRIAYLHQGPALDEATLAELATEHLGVATP
jgi:thiol-disulfide isomerase/thioredoxin